MNPNAGKGKAVRVWEEIADEMQRREIEYACHMTSGPGDAVSFLKENAFQYDQVIAVGGDGTIHEVVNGIVGSGAKLGIIPAGTGNDFARFLNWNPKQPQIVRMVEQIVSDDVTEMDLVRMQDRVFINVAGIGFDAKVAYDANQSKVLKKLGSFGYIVSVLKNLPLFKPGSVAVEVDGICHTFNKTWLIAVGNATSYGGGMRIVPDADSQDGLLDVCVVSNISRLEILRVFPQVFAGTHVGHRAVVIIRGTNVAVRTEEPFILHADGEVLQRGNCETFEILPKAIQLIREP